MGAKSQNSRKSRRAPHGSARNQPIRIGSIFVMQRGSEQHDSDDVLYESRSKEYWFSAAQFNAGVTRLQETLIECRQSYSNPAKLLEMDPAKAALPARAMKRWMRYLNDITGKTKRAAKAGYNQQLNIQYSTVDAVSDVKVRRSASLSP